MSMSMYPESEAEKLGYKIRYSFIAAISSFDNPFFAPSPVAFFI